MTRRSLFSCLFALVATILVTHNALADTNRFAVVTLLNQTPDVIVNFQYHWGDGQWANFQNFGPGARHWFSIPLDQNGQAPIFEIRINEAVGAAQPINKTYQLQWNAAPDKGIQFGHKHVIRRDQNDSDYIDVYNLGA
ncbi:MAG: hypothetical protein JO329_20430 [Planctomycetaceae bacterium]|nr:hypothetical protein [Planctomycetaceae bacterium]